MSARANQRRLIRLSAGVRHRNASVYEVPASAVMSCKDSTERRLVRLLRHRRFAAVAEKIREEIMGDAYVPTWEASREDRMQWHRTMQELGSRLSAQAGDRSDLDARQAKQHAKLLARRRKAEAKTGPPVAFLLPFPLSALSERLPNGRPNPGYDRLISANELVPVYDDGSTGDPKQYPLTGPF